MQVFLAAYGSNWSEAQIVGAILERQSILISQGTRSGNTAMTAWATDCREWTVRHMTTVSGLKR
jgi:hypothetical protein